MDADRFDTIIHSFSTGASRRSIGRALAGLTLGGALASRIGLDAAEAKKKKGKKKKKCKGGARKCGKKCIPKEDCCPSCGSGQICDQNECVTGQGTCAAGADTCPGTQVNCNGSGSCFCFTTMAFRTRCGTFGISDPNTCGNDAECAALFPGVPGVFCVAGGAPNCGEGFCVGPCPS